MLNKGLLNRTELLSLHQSLQRRNLPSLGLNCKGHAGVHRHVVYQYRACSAFTTAAAFLCRSEAQLFPQHVKQRPARLHKQVIVLAVDEKPYLVSFSRLYDSCRSLIFFSKMSGGGNSQGPALQR